MVCYITQTLNNENADTRPAFSAAPMLLTNNLAQRSKYQFNPVNLDLTSARSAVDRVVDILQQLDGPGKTSERAVDFLRSTQSAIDSMRMSISLWYCTV